VCLVWRRVSDYVDNDVSSAVRVAFESHVAECPECRSVVEGVRNVVLLFADPRVLPFRSGSASERLRNFVLAFGVSPNDLARAWMLHNEMVAHRIEVVGVVAGRVGHIEAFV
jgi:putative zinc finger protein